MSIFLRGVRFVVVELWEELMAIGDRVPAGGMTPDDVEFAFGMRRPGSARDGGPRAERATRHAERDEPR